MTQQQEKKKTAHGTRMHATSLPLGHHLTVYDDRECDQEEHYPKYTTRGALPERRQNPLGR